MRRRFSTISLWSIISLVALTACSVAKMKPKATALSEIQILKKQTEALSQTLDGKYEIPNYLGPVLWSGQLNQVPVGQRLNESAKLLGDMGFGLLRLVLSPQTVGLYDLKGLSCGNNSFLTCLVNHPSVSAAISDPRFQTVGFVVYDTEASGIDGQAKDFLNEQTVVQKSKAIVAEYRDLSYNLMSKFRGSNKRFIISAWEADNTAYCGSAYYFANNQVDTPSKGVNFRDWCLASYSNLSGGAKTPQEGLQGLKRWFEFRQQGIHEGVARAQKEGIKKVEVLGAMEFNALHLLESSGYPTALSAVASTVNFDMVTYSAYESINQNRLTTDVNEIRKILANRLFAISEFGFAPTYGDLEQAKKNLTKIIQEIVKLKSDGKIEFASIWQAFEDGSSSEFGLLNQKGVETPLFQAFLAGLKTPGNIPEDIVSPPKIQTMGGGCNGCDCAWLLGEHFPLLNTLQVHVRDAEWNIITQIPSENLYRQSSTVVTMVVPEAIRSKFKTDGIRLTMTNSAQPNWWDTSELQKCEEKK